MTMKKTFNIKKRGRVPLLILIGLLLLAFYFRPRTLWDRLGLEKIGRDGTLYCGFHDISQGKNKDWSGPASELLDETNDLLGPLLYELSLSGPVFYKNSSINPDLANLYLSLEKEDGTYEKRNIELILSYGSGSDSYSAFINIGKKGYFVTSGKEKLSIFLDRARASESD